MNREEYIQAIIQMLSELDINALRFIYIYLQRK